MRTKLEADVQCQRPCVGHEDPSRKSRRTERRWRPSALKGGQGRSLARGARARCQGLWFSGTDRRRRSRSFMAQRHLALDRHKIKFSAQRGGCYRRKRAPFSHEWPLSSRAPPVRLVPDGTEMAAADS